MLDFAIFAVTFVVFMLIVVIYIYPASSRQTTIPGADPSDPKDGNLNDIVHAGSLHEYLTDLHSKHGPIASFWLGTRMVVSIASPKLLADQKHVFDRPAELFELYKPILGESSLLFLNGSAGRARHQGWHEALSFNQCKTRFDTLYRLATEIADKWASLPHDQHISLFLYMRALCMKTCANIGFGEYFYNDKNILELSKNFEICWTELEARAAGMIPTQNSPQDQQFLKAVSNLKKTLQKAKDVNDTSKRKEDALFLHKKCAGDAPDDQVINDAITFIVKHHSVACAMTWAIYFLSTHQEVQEKLHKEIKSVLGSTSVTLESLIKLKYLRQVIDETLRISAVEPWTARVVDMDIQLGDHLVPKKTPIIHALGVIMQDGNYWSLPKTFDPERFKPECAEEYDPLIFQPFGFAGKRKCLGESLAYLELAVYLAVICQRFELHLVEGQIINPVYSLITRPEEDIWITVTPRS